MKAKFSFLTPEEPGFLRRQIEYLKLKAELETLPPDKALEKMVDFLVGFVVDPTEKKEAREAVLDLSQVEFEAALEGMAGTATPPNSSGPSGAGRKAIVKSRHGKR
jgi:hypothetical protein